MDFAILLYFDQETEKTIASWTQRLVDAGVNDTLLAMKMRPHLTVAEMDAEDVAPLEAAVDSLADQIPRLELKLASLGLFPNEAGVLFLAPIVEEPLLDFHRLVHKKLAPLSDAFSPLYEEKNWVPHCTLALELDNEQFSTAYMLMKEIFQPLTAKIVDIGIFKCCPFEEHMVRPVNPKFKMNRDTLEQP